MAAAVTTASRDVELIQDPFLSRCLGRDVRRLAVGPDADPGAMSRPRGVRSPGLVYARVPAARLDLLHALEAAGFRVADTNLSFERGRMADAPGPAGVTVRDAAPDDEAALVELARTAFTFSRFHLDPRIGPRLADAIKARWTANYFKGERGDAMAVAELGGRVGGYLLALGACDGAMVIDLVAVAEPARGRGIAEALTRFVQTRFPAATRLRVGTQLVNGPAARAYQKMGFALAGAQYVMHLHVGDAP